MVFGIVKRFNARIVETVAFATHVADHPVYLQLFLKVMRGVLASTIRMMQHRSCWFFAIPSEAQRLNTVILAPSRYITSFGCTDPLS